MSGLVVQGAPVVGWGCSFVEQLQRLLQQPLQLRVDLVSHCLKAGLMRHRLHCSGGLFLVMQNNVPASGWLMLQQLRGELHGGSCHCIHTCSRRVACSSSVLQALPDSGMHLVNLKLRLAQQV